MIQWKLKIMTYDLEAWRTKIVHFMIFNHMTGVELAELLGF